MWLILQHSRSMKSWNVHVGISSIKTTLPIPLESSGDLKEYQFLITWGFHLDSEANDSARKNNVMFQALLLWESVLGLYAPQKFLLPQWLLKGEAFDVYLLSRTWWLSGWLAGWMEREKRSEWVCFKAVVLQHLKTEGDLVILFTENSSWENLSENSHMIWVGCSAPKIPSYSKMCDLIILWIESFLLLGKMWFFCISE